MLLCSFLIISFAIYKITSNFITIESPNELIKEFDNKNKIKYGYSSFGYIPYGKTIQGKIIYDKENNLLCETNSYTKTIQENDIILADIGECSFKKKALNAQNLNTKILILIDDIDEEINEGTVLSDDEEIKQIVDITTIVISIKDGYIIKSFIAENNSTEITISIDFDIENKTDIVNYTLWYFPTNKLVYDLFEKFDNYHTELGDRMNVMIHYVLYSHMKYNEEDVKEGHFEVYDNCFGYGKYCDNNNGDYLIEALRQRCLYEKDVEAYWKYMTLMKENCMELELKCGEDVMKKMNYDIEIVKQCMKDSFISSNNNTKMINESDMKILYNKYLDIDLDLRHKEYISKPPALYINDKLYLGNLNEKYILQMICASMQSKHLLCYKEGLFDTSTPFTFITKIIIIFLFMIVILIVVYFLFKIFIHHKYKKRVISSSITRNIMDTKYIAI